MPTELDTAELARRYHAGESIAVAAASLGTSASTVRRRLLAAGVTLRPAGTPRVRPARHELQHHLDAGRTRTQIADTYGVSLAAVSRWITHYRLREPAPPRPAPHELQDLYVTRQQSLRQIGARYNVTKQAVRLWLTTAGITPRAPQGLRPDTEAEIVELYVERRLSCTEISQQLGLSSSTIKRVLQRQAIRGRRPTPALAPQHLEVALAAGIPPAVIAQRHHCSPRAVYRAIKRAGLQTQRQRRQQHAANAADNLRAHLDKLHGSD